MQPVPPAEDLTISYGREQPLPLPVRGTRVAITIVLMAVIATVVLTTYLRIEQQLQLTMERRLTSVLGEQMHSAKHWLDTRETLVSKTARLEPVTQTVRALHTPVARVSEEPEERIEPTKTLQAAVGTLLEVGLASEVYLLSSDAQKELAKLPGTAPSIEISEEALERLKERGRSTEVNHASDSGRIFNLAYVEGPSARSAILVLAIDSDALTRGLHVQSRKDRLPPSRAPSDENLVPSARTYAFDAAGHIDKPEAGGPTDPTSLGIPPSAVEVARQSQSIVTTPKQVDEYEGEEGFPVVGAWVWLGEYGLGLATEISRKEAYGSVSLLRQSFSVLVTLVGAALLGFLALGRWTLRIREESLLMTRRLSRLARAIQPLSAALEHDPSAVLLVDGDGTVVYANAASHRVLGVPSPLLGRDIDAVFDSLPKELRSVIASGQDSIVAQGANADDETLLVSSRDLRIDGNAHSLYMLRPVTQQVRRQEVEHWKKLIRILSHELNNALAPITSLLSSAKTVNQMTHQDPRLGKIFENIAERTTHLVSFLEGYKEVARLPRPAPRETSWESFFSGMESQKSFTRMGPLPKTPGYFDPVQLERVLINVLNNSKEAGSPAVDIQVGVEEEPGGFRLDIADRGTGMPEPVLKQAMLPFFSTKRTGTGVGLALSREIIEAHGGQLTLANRDGGGLMVSCFLPSAPQHPSRSSLIT